MFGHREISFTSNEFLDILKKTISFMQISLF